MKLMNELKVNHQITLKQIDLDDTDTIFHAIDSNRTHLRKWLPFVDMTKSSKDTYTFIKSLTADIERRQIVFTLWYQNEFAGLLGLKDADYLNHKVEFGYWMIEKMTGSGIMTLSVERLLKHVFEELHMNRVQIKCGVGNGKSSAIPKRLGFTFEGVERAGERHLNKYIDLEVFSLLKKEWET
jgi:ribosomal-protein-serine acetyltransferase